MYYKLFNKQAKSTLNIDEWLGWFLACLNRSVREATDILREISTKINILNWVQRIGVNDRQQSVINWMIENNCNDHVTNAEYRDIVNCKSELVRRDMKKLNQKGIFTLNPGGGRATSYRLINWKEIEEIEKAKMEEKIGLLERK